MIGGNREFHILNSIGLFLVEQAAGVGHDLDQAVGVAPFVVIPSNDLEQVAADDGRQLVVDDGGVAVADIITADQLLLSHIEDALVKRLFGCFFENLINFFDSDRPFGYNRKVT